jgi:hypothetical protein
MVSPSMTLARPVRHSVRRLNVKMAMRRLSTRRPYATRPVAQHRRIGVTASCAKAVKSKVKLTERGTVN